MKTTLTKLVPFVALIVSFPEAALAAGTGGEHIDLTTHLVGYAALVIFVVAYGFVMAEEYTHLRKSKPVLLAAGVINLAHLRHTYRQHRSPFSFISNLPRSSFDRQTNPSRRL